MICHPERSKQSGELFAESNHPIGWRPVGAGSTKFDRRYRKSFVDPTFGAVLWDGSTPQNTTPWYFASLRMTYQMPHRVNSIPPTKPNLKKNNFWKRHKMRFFTLYIVVEFLPFFNFPRDTGDTALFRHSQKQQPQYIVVVAFFSPICSTICKFLTKLETQSLLNVPICSKSKYILLHSLD